MDIFDLLRPDSYYCYPYGYVPLRKRGLASSRDDKNPASTTTASDSSKDAKKKNFETYLHSIFNADPTANDMRHNVAEERCNMFSVIDPETKKTTAYGVQIVYAPFKKSDISVETRDQRLIINVGMAEARGSSGGTREFHYHKIDCEPFQIVLPFREICYWNTECEIDEDMVKASTDEGVLEIILPVVSKTTSRRVALD